MKDAKGHGSDKRGTSAPQTAPANVRRKAVVAHSDHELADMLSTRARERVNHICVLVSPRNPCSAATSRILVYYIL
jgi:hypothetical protein